MLWWFQVNSEGTRPHIYKYPFSPKLPSHPACHLTLSIEQSSLCYTVGPCWLSILWQRLFEGLHKHCWFPETNNPHFPIHCVQTVFPKHIFFGVLTKEGQRVHCHSSWKVTEELQWRLEWMSPPFAKLMVKSSSSLTASDQRLGHGLGVAEGL